MKLEVKIQLLTFFSTVLNFIFLALGLSLFFCGVWILFNRDNLLTVFPSDELRTVGAGLLLIGPVVSVVSVIGCLSAVKENKLLLLIYQGFLIVLVLGQLYVMLLLLFSDSKITDKVDEALVHMIVEYRGNRSLDRIIDNIQHYESCCGKGNSSDWLKNEFIKNQPDLLPCSCFNLTRQSTETWCRTESSSVLHQGCEAKVHAWLQENFNTVFFMDLGLILLQVVLSILMSSLYRAISRKAELKKRPPVDADHAPLDQDPEEDLTNGEQNYGYVDSDDGYNDSAHPENLHDHPELDEDPRFYTNNRL